MAEPTGTRPIYYPDFIRLLDIGMSEYPRKPDGSFDWVEDLRIRPSGIYLATVPCGVHITDEEFSALPQHPTGNYDEPIATFPMTLERLLELLDEFGLSDCLDPDVLSEWTCGPGGLATPPAPIPERETEAGARERERADDLSIELYPLLERMKRDGERVTPANVMAQLQSRAGHHGSCIREHFKDGVIWLRGSTGSLEKLDMRALKKRVARWSGGDAKAR